MDFLQSSWVLPLAGICVGSLMGYFARRHHFCTMSALERHWFASDSNGLRSWVLAAATALAATQLLDLAGWVNVDQSFYLTEPMPIAGAILGGLLFGIGMALVGTCGFGAIVRLGGGNLRALVVLTGIGLAALAAQRGFTGHLRVLAIDPLAFTFPGSAGQSLAAPLNAFTNMDLTAVLGLGLSALMFWWIFYDIRFRQDKGKIIAGAVIGLSIAAGWVITSQFSTILFDPVQIEAGSFVMPVGDTIMQIITITGTIPDYGVGLVVGVLFGASFGAWQADDMRWEACDDARELGRHLLGSFLMGTGGVFALGCTIGQGVSAVSVLAASAPVAMLSIALGARIGLGILIEGSALGFLLPIAAPRKS